MTLHNHVALELLKLRFPETHNDESWLATDDGTKFVNTANEEAIIAIQAIQEGMPCWARVNCWKCGEEVDPSSSEKYIYRNIIRKMEDMMCQQAKVNNFKCDNLEHSDCTTLESLIKDYRSLLEPLFHPEDERRPI
jgi:hypothetical protein